MLTALFIDTDSISLGLARVASQVNWQAEAKAVDLQLPNIEAGFSCQDYLSRGGQLELQGMRLINGSYAWVYSLSYLKAKSSSKQVTQAVSGFIKPTSDTASAYEASLGLKSRWFGRVGHYYLLSFGWQQSKLNLFSHHNATISGGGWFGGEIFRQSSVYASKQRGGFVRLGSEHHFKYGNLGVSLDLARIAVDSRVGFAVISDQAYRLNFTELNRGLELGLNFEYSYPLNKQAYLLLNYQYRQARLTDKRSSATIALGDYHGNSISDDDIERQNLNVGMRWLF